MQSSFWKRCVTHLLIACVFSALAACGGGGGGSDSSNGGSDTSSSGGGNPGGGNPGGGNPGGGSSTVIGLNANRDIVDDPAIYADVSPEAIDNIQLFIPPPAPGGKCTADDGTGDEDYSGCTLADLRGDADGDDAFDPEVRAHFTADDYPDDGLVTNARIEIRGNTSRFATQKSYKVKLDKDLPNGKWHGQRELQLNKHPFDLSRIRNKLAFDLFRKVDDFPSLRTQFVHLFVTNQAANAQASGQQDFGLFTHVEHDDDHWAEMHGQDENGNIFKAEQFEFLPLYATPALEGDPGSDAFELILKSEGDNDDTAALLAMIEAVNDESNDFRSVFDQYFHPDNFRTWLAINILLSNRDSNSQNFYLYRPESIDSFYFTPWDYDGAWDSSHQPLQANGPQPPRWQMGLSNWWNVRVVQRYIRNGGVPALTEKINELNSSVVNAATVQSIIDGYPLQQLATIESQEPDFTYLPVDGGSTQTKAQQRNSEIERLPGTIAKALNIYKANLERPMPYFLDIEVIDGNVTLEWDPSYDIQGDALVYDVRLARSPVMGATSSLCTQQSGDPVPVLSENLEMQKSGVNGDSLTVDHDLAPGQTYYLQVIARDSKGYCQIAFGNYSGNSGQEYFGVKAFDYDGTNVTQVD